MYNVLFINILIKVHPLKNGGWTLLNPLVFLYLQNTADAAAMAWSGASELERLDLESSVLLDDADIFGEFGSG